MQLTNKPGNGQPEMASLKEKGACALLLPPAPLLLARSAGARRRCIGPDMACRCRAPLFGEAVSMSPS